MNPTVHTYEPGAKQSLFHESGAKYRLAMGGYGSGKTTMGVWEDILQALEYPGSVGVFYRKTYPALRDSTLRSYLEECPPELISRFVRTEGREAIEFTNSSKTLLRCLDDYLKLGSMQFDRVSIDEAGEVGEREFRALAFGRLRGTIGPRRLMAYTNPVDDTHWLYEFFVNQAGPDTACFHFSTYDNAAHLPDGYIARLEQMSPAEQRMYLHGLWGVVAQGRLAFPTFNEAIHVGDFRVIPNHPTARGWDPGFTHPACVWTQTDALGHTRVLHELLGDGEDIATFAIRVRAEHDKLFHGCPTEDYCDIAGTQQHDTAKRGQTAVNILRNRFQLRVHTRKVPVAKSLQGMRDILNQLGNNGVPLLTFNRPCRKLIRGMAGGLWINPRTGEIDRQNIYIHLLDALRYVLAPALLPMRSQFEGRSWPKHWRVA